MERTIGGEVRGRYTILEGFRYVCFAAENVVITDYIDLSKFDISTLQLTSTSHSCRTAISEGNKVQFIFDKIMLPFTEPEKHGYVAFIHGSSLKSDYGKSDYNQCWSTGSFLII